MSRPTEADQPHGRLPIGVFARLDTAFEAIAADAESRLERSHAEG
ncbi:hypothetical protein [Roseateles sp. P5_E11]